MAQAHQDDRRSRREEETLPVIIPRDMSVSRGGDDACKRPESEHSRRRDVHPAYVCGCRAICPCRVARYEEVAASLSSTIEQVEAKSDNWNSRPTVDNLHYLATDMLRNVVRCNGLF